MALLTISGEPASRWEEAAHIVARLLKFELITEARLEQWLRDEFSGSEIAARAWRPAVTSIAARMAAEHHLVIAAAGAEALFGAMPMLLRGGGRAGVAARRQRDARPAPGAAGGQKNRRRNGCRGAPQPPRPAGTRRRVAFPIRHRAERRGAGRRADGGGAARGGPGARISRTGPAFGRGGGAHPVPDAAGTGAARDRAGGPGPPAARRLRPSERGAVRESARFLPDSLGVRAALVSAAVGQGRQCDGGVHPRFLSSGVRSVRRTDHHEAGAGDAKKP